MTRSRLPHAIAALGVLWAVAFLAPASVLGQGPDGPHPPNYGNPGDDLPPGQRGTPNIKVLGNLPLGGYLHVADVEIEQELDRPYAYISKRFDPTGMDIVSLEDPENPKLIYSWRIENSALHQGSGALDGRYFKLDGRYYIVQSTQFGAGGPDNDLGAIIFDVTGLPDPSTVREVGRIRTPETPGGFHNIFTYKHSDGRALLFTTVNGPHANIYDLGKFLAGDPDQGLVGQVPVPQTAYWAMRGGRASWHDYYVAYDPATQQDRLWAGGTGGYFVFDVTDTSNPELLVSVTGVNGITQGHTFTPSPDGLFAVAEVESQWQPLRLFDLRDAWSPGGNPVVSRAISAWTADYENLSHNHEVRWPFVFVAAYEDGLQVFSMFDPYNPRTVAYYDTYPGPHMARGHGNVNLGAWGVDVRNADGLIVVSDMVSGLWTFKMEGFPGWDGRNWSMPNISSAQDWDNGPRGPQPRTTSDGGRN